MSTTLSRGALAAAVLTSAIALGDAVWQATADGPAPWAPHEGIEWVWRAGEASHGITYALLAALLAHSGGRIDAGRAVVRWLRRVLAVVLGVLGAGYLASAAVELDTAGPMGAVMGVGFLALFPLAVALGAVLVARRETRYPGAWVLVSVVPLIGLTAVASTVGWAHPGYVETAVYLGLALLGVLPRAVGERGAEPALSGWSR
ncbi:UNVERIFIED_ORG: hypothetical protein E4P37_06570 [Bacillus sp. AZ43]